MLAVSDLLLEQHANLLRQGTVLVDPTDDGLEPWLMFLVTHEVKSGDGQILSKRLQFVRVNPDGSTSFAGWAPHLDLEPLDSFLQAQQIQARSASEGSTKCERSAPTIQENVTRSRVGLVLPTEIQTLLEQPWIRADQEQRAVALAATTLVPDHFREVNDRRVAHVDKTLAAVHERLSKEIEFWSDRWLRLKEDQEAGKDVRLNVENARRTVTDLEGRLENRKKELQSMRHVVNGTPVVLGGALVVPAGLMRRQQGYQPDTSARDFPSPDPIARSRIERIAMDAVRHAEESRGCHVVDVSADKCGWDLTSYPPAEYKPDAPARDHLPDPRHIEVKGRVKGAATITVTHNEMLYAFNQGDKFILAIVLVNEDDSYEGPYYIRRPFDREPGWGVSSINYNLSDLLQKAESR
jgi:hypothetical protein